VFDAADRVRQIADMLRTVLGARIDLSLDIGCDSCFVDADAGQFETALVNLAVNARDAMHGEGQLTIAVRERQGVPKVRGHGGAGGNFVTICVADTGSGIADDHIRRIFEPFFTTKEVGKGTGLGLSQVYGFAKQSGGEIDVASAIGEGTTFTMFLPQVEPATGVPVVANGTPPTKGKGIVLIVEDNSAVGEFATQLLVDLGYEPTWATDALKALEILASGKVFDVIFTDVVMPGLSGVELARRVREQYPTVPVVLTSGYSDQLVADGRHGFPVLNKPYSAEALARILRRAIAGA
jgi:CheY-like chemotaxis protein